MTRDGLRVLIAIATYKERANLEALVRGIHEAVPHAHVLITDDNSPDGTGELADRLSQGDPRVHVNHRPGKLGLGTAILAGLRFALAKGYDVVVSMDADFSHDPRHLPALLAGIKFHDVMIGSRYVSGGAIHNWPRSRLFMSHGVNILVRFLMRLPARDCSGGFRAYSAPLLRRTAIDRLVSHGYSFQEEMLLRCWQAGARIGEIPIIFENRKEGASKVNLGEMIRSLAVLLRLGLGVMFGWEKRPTTHHAPLTE